MLFLDGGASTLLSGQLLALHAHEAATQPVLENLGNILWLLSWIFVQEALGVWTSAGVDEEDGDEEQGEGGKERRERGEEDKMKKVVMENPMMSLSGGRCWWWWGDGC